MRKIIFALAFMLAGTFVFADTLENSGVENTKKEQLLNKKSADFNLNYKINLKEDICTITVTVTLSNGNSYSATASNNQANCDAAYDAAYNHAMLLAGVFQ